MKRNKNNLGRLLREARITAYRLARELSALPTPNTVRNWVRGDSQPRTTDADEIAGLLSRRMGRAIDSADVWPMSPQTKSPAERPAHACPPSRKGNSAGSANERKR